jgi:hypothetical protein
VIHRNFSSGGWVWKEEVMRRSVVELSPGQEIALRRIAYGIVRRSALKTSDVEHLTSLDLAVARGTGLVLAHRGERLVADLPAGNLQTKELIDDPHIAAVAKALGVKR